MLKSATAASTNKVYRAAVASYGRFADKFDMPNIQYLSVDSLSLYISYMQKSDRAGNTIITYASGLIQEYKFMSGVDLAGDFVIKRLFRALRRGVTEDNRLPITKSLLRRIMGATTSVCHTEYEASLFRCLFSFMFYGLLRVSEACAARMGEVGNKATSTLLRHHVQFTEEGGSKRVSVIIARSKTDQLGKSTALSLKAITGDKSCPWKAAKVYLRARPKGGKEFFVHKNGEVAVDRQVLKVLKLCLEFLEVQNIERYGTHSFRIGRCSDLAKKGVGSRKLIDAGRWSSSIYKTYIRLGSS